jgi:hypothetical protein
MEVNFLNINIRIKSKFLKLFYISAMLIANFECYCINSNVLIEKLKNFVKILMQKFKRIL